MMHLPRDERYTQRNNPFKPGAACMPTTWVMWCIAEGLRPELVDYCRSIRLPMNLLDNHCMELLNTAEAIAFASGKYHSLIELGYAPNEIHGMFHSWLEPRILGRGVSDFLYADPSIPGTGLTYDDFARIIASGHSLWTSGWYEGQHGRIAGHANGFFGLTDGGVLVNVDPYGSPHTKYRDDDGYGVLYPRGFFNLHIKGVGARKNAHVKRGIK